MKIDVCMTFALLKWSYKTRTRFRTRFSWEISRFCQFYDFQIRCLLNLAIKNTLFWIDCQFNYYNVALYAVWRNVNYNFVSLLWVLAGPLCFFSIAIFVWPHWFKTCEWFWRIDKIFNFSKIQIPIKLFENAQILSNFKKQWVLSKMFMKIVFL